MNRTVLILDDEAETRRGYQQFLAPQNKSSGRRSSRSGGSTDKESSSSGKEQYHLLVASTGEEALDIVKKELAEGRQVAAGFFDVKLGDGMDGLTTINEIKKIDPEIHCVVVTAYHDRTVDEIDTLFGEDFKDQWDYLNKPFTEGEIVQKARQMVAAWNRLKQIELMNQQLVASERLAAVGQVARGIGHEFGNILLRIVGKADIALMENDVEKIKTHLEVIISASERAEVIVRNLQSFSKSDPKFENGSVQKCFEQCLSLMNHELVKASVKADTHFNKAPNIKHDPGAISQVFLNLMVNATHAMPSGGKLTLSIDTVDQDGKKWVACKIKDSGVGIPKDVLPRIFEHAFSTKGDKGSGLGLAISKQIVESHSGKLLVETEKDKGTTFTILLPT